LLPSRFHVAASRDRELEFAAHRGDHDARGRHDVPWKPTITISATASDPDGSVRRFESRDGTTVLGPEHGRSDTYTWRGVPVGSHALVVRATDNAGAVTTSAPVGIIVRPKR
jgi:hypothetical protein